ncbi:MAG: hypothetical protein WAK20_21850 [Candidatus Acidiferrum sp.]
MKQKPSANEPLGRLPKGDCSALFISEVKAQKMFADRSAPRRTLQKRKVKPTGEKVEKNASPDQGGPSLNKIGGQRLARMVFKEKAVPEIHSDGQEGNKHAKRNR